MEKCVVVQSPSLAVIIQFPSGWRIIKSVCCSNASQVVKVYRKVKLSINFIYIALPAECSTLNPESSSIHTYHLYIIILQEITRHAADK